MGPLLLHSLQELHVSAQIHHMEVSQLQLLVIHGELSRQDRDMEISG